MKPVFHGTHISGRGWLKAQKRALLELPDDFKPKFKLSKVKHTSQDLCLDFSRLLPCHIREFLCHKWGQALTNTSKNRWRSNRSSRSLIMLLRVHLKSTLVRRVQSPYWFLFRTQFSLAREAHARAFTILVSRFSSTLDSGVNAL